jgi:uncharacterized protein YndB with AHSA1/START domain
MEVMQQLIVEKRLEFEASPERVWEAITDPEQIRRWFPDRVEIDEFQPGHGSVFEWGNHGRYAFEVEEMHAPERLVWRWARDPDVGLGATPNTVVEWLLTRRDDRGTILHLRESGFGTEELRQGNDDGWDKELGELIEYLAA